MLGGRKMTQAEFLAVVAAVHGVGRYDYSQAVYTGRVIKVAIICPTHGVFEQTPANHMQGQGCPTCGRLRAGLTKASNREEFITNARAVHGDKYDYTKVVYRNAVTKVEISCPAHGPFLQPPGQHLDGNGCLPCGRALAGHKRRNSAREVFVEKARKVHGDRYDYSQVEYLKAILDVQIICSQHGVFTQNPHNHLHGKGCPECGTAKRAALKFSRAKAVFVQKARSKHGDKYDYSATEYNGTDSSLTVTCPLHGPFNQSPGVHLRGGGCQECARLATANAMRITIEEFLARAQQTHGNKYDYSLVEINEENRLINIICPLHGVFQQCYQNHMKGHGCDRCAHEDNANNLRLTTEEFIEKAQTVHGLKYDYSKSVYTRSKDLIIIGCPVHGYFEQRAGNHLLQIGCSACGEAQRGMAWIEQAGGRPATLYLLAVYDEEESFYKIGITYATVEKRYNSAQKIGGYAYKVLATYVSSDAKAVYEWEQSIIETFSAIQYTPLKPFAGMTECFSAVEPIYAVLPVGVIFYE